MEPQTEEGAVARPAEEGAMARPAEEGAVAGSSQARFHPEGQRIIEAAARGGWEVGTVLPYHLPNCFGCGPENRTGLGLRVEVAPEPDTVRTRLVLPRRFEGAPGVAHGGAVAALFDDLFGYVLMRVLTLAVTKELTVRYRRPVRLAEELEAVARLDHRDDRDLYVSGEIIQGGIIAATATAIFTEVSVERVFGGGAT